jgi:hypothetical protein
MTWRILLAKLSFPLLIFVLLLWGGLSVMAHQREHDVQVQAAAAEKQAEYDSRHMAQLEVTNYTGCGIKDYGEKPVDVDGDPKHAKTVLWTELQCKERTFTIWGRLPTLVTQR